MRRPRSRVSIGAAAPRFTPQRVTRASAAAASTPVIAGQSPSPAAAEAPGRPRFALKLRTSCPPLGNGKYQHGVTSLKVHPGTSRLLASCYGSSHYLFDASRPELGSISSFSGHQGGSFYIKADFSPCGTHFVSGSMDEKLYVWQVDRPQDGPYVYEGHSGEVCDVAWCPDNFFQIASSSDDASVRLWSVARDKDGPKAPRRLQLPPAAPERTAERPARGGTQQDSSAPRSPLALVSRNNLNRYAMATPATQTPVAALTPSSIPLHSSLDPSPMPDSQPTPVARLWMQPTPTAEAREANATSQGSGGSSQGSLKQVSIRGFLSVPQSRRSQASQRRRTSVPGQPGQLSISSFFLNPEVDTDRGG